jgi:predicted Zn-dependent protease
MNPWITHLETWFDQVADGLCSRLRGDEGLTLKLDAEDQDYVRFNGGRVRQATAVRQLRLKLDYQARQRRSSQTLTLTGQTGPDRQTLDAGLERLRRECEVLPPDPWITPLQNHGQSRVHHAGALPPLAGLIDELASQGQAHDFTGLLAQGSLVRANRNSLGQSHWFSAESLFIDYSLYTVNPEGRNKAVKGFYAGAGWDRDRHAAQWARQVEALRGLQRPDHPLTPGEYRVYLAPAAVDDLIGMLSWGGSSYQAYREGRCALGKLFDGKATLSPRFTLRENFALGLTPRFNSLGEWPPESLTVVDQGQPGSLLISSRSAAEYQRAGNAAEPGGEGLRTPELLPGDLDPEAVLQRLGTGLYLANLHYLNWSDVQEARITGMTRYACFRVENGEITAPIRDMRFDESLYRLFGSALEALTTQTERCLSTDTYGQRSLGGSQVPGILVSEFRMTL